MRPPTDMMQDDDEPIDREAWQRALKRGGGEPPRATDERIRAAARRALAPHTGRWWLPASLAASLLLAVLIVQWQYEEAGSPAPMTESDVAPAAAPDAGFPAVPEAAAPAADAAPASMADHEDEGFGPAPTVQTPAPMMQAPAPPAPAAAGKTAPAELRVQHGEAQRPPAERAALPVQETAASPAAGPGVIGNLQRKEAAAAAIRTPEQWYAEIEALRAAGRNAEADAELARLEQAYPGWLEGRLEKDR